MTEDKNYIDDIELTRVLLRDKSVGEGKVATNELAEMYLLMVERILSRPNFRGYTEEYKNELRGNAHIFFARYWWKFSPDRIQFNVRYKESIDNYIAAHPNLSEAEIEGMVFKDLPLEYKIMKPSEEWKGVFSYFSTLIFSAFLGGLKSLNKHKPFIEDAKIKTSSIKEDVASEYYIRGFNDLDI